jgi:hypothetical protein
MMCVKIFFVCVFVCMLSLIALAGGGKNPDSCAGVGSVLVHCYECRDDTKRYLGKVAVLTGYEEAQGENFVSGPLTPEPPVPMPLAFLPILSGFTPSIKWG